MDHAEGFPVFVNGREKRMLPVLHYDQLVRSAFPVEDVAGYEVTWGLETATGPVPGVGGELKPGEAFDVREAMRGDDVGAVVAFTVVAA